MFHLRPLTVFQICLEFSIYQISEYASSSKYARVLNTLFSKYKKNLFSKKYRKFRFLKIRTAFFEKIYETFQSRFSLRKNMRNSFSENVLVLRPKGALGRCIIYDR